MLRNRILLCSVILGFTLFAAGDCFADAAADLGQVEAYVKSGQFSQAEGLCNSITQSNPGSDAALKAQGKLATIYIMTARMSQADATVETLINNFRNNAELPAVLYGIAGRFRQSREFQRAENLSQRICQEFPNSEQTQKIQFDSGKEQALKLLADGKFTQVEDVVNSMVASAGSNPAMPATLFAIAREFKDAGMYDETARIYQRIVQNYPNSKFAGRARMGIDKLKIWNLIKAGDMAGAQTGLAKLISDYRGNDDLPHTVHGVALKFEEAGFYQQAKALYWKVKQDYADDPIAAKTTVDLKKCDIRAMVGTSSFIAVSQQIAMLRQSFPGNAHLPLAIYQIGEEYYRQAMRSENAGQAKELYRNSAEILNIVINQLPDSASTPVACSCAGICYEKLGEYGKANQCYQKVIDGFPGYNLRWNMIFKVGYNWEQMKRTGAIPAEQADAQTKTMYEKILAEYPDCKASKPAQKWLEQQ